MQATYDSQTRKLTRRGDHDGTPRIWTVTNNLTYADGEKQKMVFKTKQKVQISQLSDLIDAHIREEIAVRGVAVTRHVWTAIAR